jgi:sphingolipid 8-(E/Z)-desaturase
MLHRHFIRRRSTKHNWEVYPVRSSVEVGTTNAVAWAVWYGTGSVCLTLGMTLFWGPMMIIFNEFIVSHEYDIEHSAEIPSAEEAEEFPEQEQQASSPAKIPAPPKPRSTGAKKLFTLDEVRQHKEADDMFLLIENEVYDVTEFAKTHPGGSIIYKYGGKDASDQFRAFHRPRVAGYLKKFHVGSLDPKDAPEVDPATKDYRELRSKLWKEGYFKANPTFYNLKHCVWISLVALSVMTILNTSNFYVQTLFGGACLGIGWQQAAFLAHDAAHHGIREPPKKGCTNWLAWFLGSVVFGISTNMWNEEHSMHHAITVRPREDPQFNYLPIWLIDMKELCNEKVDGKGGYKLNPFIRFLVSLQHFTFVPLILIIGRVNLHLISIGFELKSIFLERKLKEGLTGILGMAIYWTWHLALLSLLPSTTSRVWFSVASHLSAGILHIQLLLSHLNVQTMDEEEEDSAGFFKFQMAVSRNIDVHWTENWFHGGLEYQIEHHLFPQLPRHELGNVKPMVEELCEKHGVLYRNDSFGEAMKGVLGNMRELAWAVVTLEQ